MFRRVWSLVYTYFNFLHRYYTHTVWAYNYRGGWHLGVSKYGS